MKERMKLAGFWEISKGRSIDLRDSEKGRDWEMYKEYWIRVYELVSLLTPIIEMHFQ
jgi:hypothetical protein